MRFLMTKKSGKIRGIELSIAGGVILVLNQFFATFTPLALVAYGIYRLIVRKNYFISLTSVLLGAAFWFFIIATIKLILWAIGGGMLLMGLYFLFIYRPKTIENNDKNE